MKLSVSAYCANLGVGHCVRIPLTSSRKVEEELLNCLGPDCDWKLEIWTSPLNQNPDEVSSAVFVLRSDGMTDLEIEKRRAATVDPNPPLALDTLVYCPLREGYQCGKRHGLRRSTLQWELMSIGDQRVMRCSLRDVRRFVGNAIVSRGLPWEFRLYRLREEEKLSGMPTAVWRVIRVK